MDSSADLTITIKVDTEQAQRDVEEFQSYALQVLDDIKSAYASYNASVLSGGGDSASPELVGDQSQKRRA